MESFLAVIGLLLCNKDLQSPLLLLFSLKAVKGLEVFIEFNIIIRKSDWIANILNNITAISYRGFLWS